MHRFVFMTLAVLIAGTLGSPDEARGQGTSRDPWECEWEDGERQCRWTDRRDEGWGNHDRRDRDRDGGWWDIILGDGGDRYDRDRERRGLGPAFCRSGAGHPVFGRRWCMRKGFGLGERGGLGGWGDIIFQSPRRRTGVILEERDLMDILGDIIFMRLAEQRNEIGARGQLVGHWIEREAATILRLRAGRIPIAEFRDGDGDRRVDRVLLNTRR